VVQLRAPKRAAGATRCGVRAQLGVQGARHRAVPAARDRSSVRLNGARRRVTADKMAQGGRDGGGRPRR
jgi:hypothetical protein